MLFLPSQGEKFTQITSKSTMTCLSKTDHFEVVTATECAIECLDKKRGYANAHCSAFKYDASLKKCTACVSCGGDMSAITPLPSTDFTHFLIDPHYHQTLNKGKLNLLPILLLIFFDKFYHCCKTDSCLPYYRCNNYVFS